MGLAAPRKRVKISHDPNNNTWAQSTSGFGHKIMTSQGWTPGSYLGARNANHSDTFTAASASHIRVTLKDDTLGLGARAPTLGNDNVAAIDAFQGLLGRLNGKSEVQLEQEQRKRDDTRLALYASQKWQAVNFISGGFLVQEKPTDALKSITNKKPDFPNDADQTSSDESKDGPADEKFSAIEDEMSISKREEAGKDTDGTDTREKRKKKDKSDKKVKRDREKKEKKEKKDKKKETKRDKEGKKKDKHDSSKKRRRAEKDAESESSDSSRSDTAENNNSRQQSTSLQAPKPNWRHAIRGRHIQQKRMAIMDERSLGEIFMINA